MKEPSAGDVVRRVKSAGRREHPDEVKAAIAKLEAMGAVRPELAPVVQVALEVVRSARDEVRDAVVRAEIAEETLGQVRPHVDELAEEADRLRADVERRDSIDAAEDVRKSRESEAAARAEADKRGWEVTPGALKAAGAVAKQVEHLRTAQTAQAAGVAKAVQILVCIHKAVKNEDGKSPIQCFKESGEWTVSDADDGVIAVLAKRSEAIQLVADLLSEELAEADAAKSADQDEEHRPDDTMHRPEPWRRKRPAGVEPAQSGEVTPGVSKRKRKNSHIL